MNAPVSTLADAPDPIFAAIRRHTEAWDAFGVASKRADEAEAARERRTVTTEEESAAAAGSALERGCSEAFLRTMRHRSTATWARRAI
jgi:hypothetical protein